MRNRAKRHRKIASAKKLPHIPLSRAHQGRRSQKLLLPPASSPPWGHSSQPAPRGALVVRLTDNGGVVAGRLEDGGDELGQPEPGRRRRGRGETRDGGSVLQGGWLAGGEEEQLPTRPPDLRRRRAARGRRRREGRGRC
jgi:hypothetical protein